MPPAKKQKFNFRPGPTSTTARPVLRIDGALKKKRQLEHFALVINNAAKRIREKPDVMETNTQMHDRIMNYLNTLSYKDFATDKELRDAIEPSGLLEGLQFATKTKGYGTIIRGMARELLDRFENQQWDPAPLESFPAGESDSEDESNLFEYENKALTGWSSTKSILAGGSNPFNIPKADIDAACKHIFRGLVRSPNQSYYRLKIPAKSSAIFGDNGIPVGTWWPYREAARRDGAHGAIQAGIFGNQATGAYSIVCSGGSAYEDLDCDDGITMLYSGSINPKDLNAQQAIATRDTNKLRMSVMTGRSVRVIRGMGGSWGPETGYRYDGLYKATKMEEGKGIHDGKTVMYYRFKLVREPGQTPLERIIERSPTNLEKAAWIQDKWELMARANK